MNDKLAAPLLCCREIANSTPKITTVPVAEAISRCLRRTSSAVSDFDDKKGVVLQDADRVISTLVQREFMIILDLLGGLSTVLG